MASGEEQTNQLSFPPGGIGCVHQKQSRSLYEEGSMDRVTAQAKANGEMCTCEDRVMPCGYTMPNLGDKGNKQNNWIFISNSLFKRMQASQIIKRSYFEKKESPKSNNFFVNSVGNHLKSISMVWFNQVVTKQNKEKKLASFTPVQLRKFYSTFLKNNRLVNYRFKTDE